MTNASDNVQLIDVEGRSIGSKRRSDVNKTTDGLHTIGVFVLVHDAVLFSIIKQGDVFGGMFGMPVMSILRVGERPEEAALRGLQNELGVVGANLRLLGESMETIEGLGPRLVSIFCITLETTPVAWNSEKVQSVTQQTSAEINKVLDEHPERFAASFKVLWKKYQSALVE